MPAVDEDADCLDELALVVGRVGPDQRQFGRARPVISRPISATWATKRQVSCDERRQACEYGDRMPLNHDPDFYGLAERGQVEDAVDGLRERAGGLDDEIVQAWLGRVHRDADHDVRKTDGRVAAGEPRVGEAAAIRQQVNRQFRCGLRAVVKQANERVRVQGRLAAREADRPRCPPVAG